MSQHPTRRTDYPRDVKARCDACRGIANIWHWFGPYAPDIARAHTEATGHTTHVSTHTDFSYSLMYSDTPTGGDA